MLLHEYLRQSSRERPAKVALVAGQSRITYAQLARDTDTLSGALVRAGVHRGDRVAIYLENTPETVLGVFGTLAAGGVFVVVNPATQPDRLGFVLENCGARILLTSQEKLPAARQALTLCTTPPALVLAGTGGVPAGATSFATLLATPVDPPRLASTDVDLAGIIYTSGSTGKPKGVCLSHGNIHAVVEGVTEYLEHTERDVVLCVLPLSSSYGLLQLFVPFFTGGTVVLEKGVMFPYEVVRRIREEGVTGFAGAPTVFAILLRLEGLENEGLSSLRYITNAAAAMPASFVPRIRKAFPSARLFLMHGLTECLRTTYLPPEDLDTRPTSVGRGMPNVELWVADNDGRPLGAGKVGEMMVRGPNIMQGYWNDPEATARMILPGRHPWEKVLRTGDLFTMDEDGYFTFVARSDELIKSRGEKVSPIEVENAIYTLEGVAEVRVVGVPDAVLGQAIRAEVVLKPGRALDEAAVKGHCKRQLEDFKVPQTVVFVESLPKTAGGKIKRSKDTIA
jgi:long-chain acyl-CoA synthetase